MPEIRFSVTLILFDFIFALYKWRQVLTSLDLKVVKTIPERILRPSSSIFPPLSLTLCSPGLKMFSYFHSVPMIHLSHYVFARPWIQASWTKLMSSYVVCALRICQWQGDGKEWVLTIHGSTDFHVLHLQFSIMILTSLEAYHFSLPTIFLSASAIRQVLKELN